MKGKLLKAVEAAELLQVRKSTIYKWAHYGYIPHIKLGSSLRFDKDSFRDYRGRRLKQWLRHRDWAGKYQGCSLFFDGRAV